MNDKTEGMRKVCDCNQGRLPCTCKPVSVIILKDENFNQLETDLESRPLQTNLSAQRLLRRPTRWS